MKVMSAGNPGSRETIVAAVVALIRPPCLCWLNGMEERKHVASERVDGPALKGNIQTSVSKDSKIVTDSSRPIEGSGKNLQAVIAQSTILPKSG